MSTGSRLPTTSLSVRSSGGSSRWRRATSERGRWQPTTSCSVSIYPTPSSGAVQVVGAENHVTASDQRCCHQTTTWPEPGARTRGQASIIDHHCLSACVPDARPRAELAGAARTFRGGQGRRDLGAAPRGCRAAPTQPAPDAELGRPRAAQRAEPAPPGRSAPAAARVTENFAALARPARRPPLELSATTTRPPHHVANGSPAGVADGPGRTHGGGTDASTASWSDSTIGSPRPPYGRSSRRPVSIPPRDGPGRPGDSS
jgi:hypothetical protein